MQIILLHSRLHTKSITLTQWHLIGIAAVFFSSVILVAALLYYLTFRHAADLGVPVVRDLLVSANRHEEDKRDQYIKENLAAMAIKLGEMQAQLMRLDALGERVQGLILPRWRVRRLLPPRAGSSLRLNTIINTETWLKSITATTS